MTVITHFWKAERIAGQLEVLCAVTPRCAGGNHGFFVDKPGIGRSPAYHSNPSVDRNELSLAIDETETTCDISVAMNAHKTYGTSSAQADAALESVQAAVAGWRTEATRFRIPKAEQELMAAAFE